MKHNIGDTKVVTRFLLFPKRIGTEWRWLRTSTFEKKLMDYQAMDPAGFSFDSYKWYSIKWIN